MAQTTIDAEALVNAEAAENGKNSQPQAKQAGLKKSPARKRRKRRGKRKSQAAAPRIIGGAAPFPRTTLEATLELGNGIQEHAAGQRIRRATLFEKLNKSPDSGPTRALITTSNKYGITSGGYQAEFLELTPQGAVATNPESSERERLKARFDLAIKNVPAFNHLYDNLREKRVPSPEVMRDTLGEFGIAEAHRKEAVDLFLENAKFLGLLRTTAGAERLASIEQALEALPPEGNGRRSAQSEAVALQTAEIPTQDGSTALRATAFENMCFVIGPIGEEDSEERKHSDMVLETLIRRGLEGEKLTIIRADGIGDPGMISEQVLQYLIRSKLVIADLSFHNPNVFYELAIRHVTGLPTVHLIRKDDQIPFDLKDSRTIIIDTSDKYELVASLDTYRAQIANHVRAAASSGLEGSNPVRTFCKELKVDIAK